MGQEPISRLNTMLEVFENAPEFHGIEAWQAYLLERLPQFALPTEPASGYFHGQRMEIEQLWDQNGYPEIGEIFAEIYHFRYDATWILADLPIIKDSYIANSRLSLILALEAMRQALQAMRYVARPGQGLPFKGLRCFCGPDVRSTCGVKEILKAFWQVVAADEGYEKLLEQHWQKLECM